MPGKSRPLCVAAFTLAAATLLAGCSADGPATTGSNATQEGPARLEAPTWALHDAWTYEFGGQTASYVITQDLGTDWFMQTDNADRAFEDARRDISRLGEQRKADLAGSQNGNRVEFFRWPLEAGKTWTTNWDNAVLTLKVLDVAPPLAHLEGRYANGTLDYLYTYDATVGWFRDLIHYAPDGSELIALHLTEARHDWTGFVTMWDLAVATDKTGTLDGGAHEAVNFEVPLTATDVWVDLAVTCTQGVAIGGVAPLPIVTSVAGVDDRGIGVGGEACPLTSTATGSIGSPRPPAQGGTSEAWGWSLVATPAPGTYDALVYVRTKELVAVGAVDVGPAAPGA